LAKSEELEALIEHAREFDLGLVVAAAGFGSSGPMVSSSLQAELEMIRVNCEAAFRLAHGLGPGMIERGRGAFVFLSSVVAWQGVAGQASYSATKAFVQSLAEGLASEWKPHGVQVHAAAPGPVESEFARRAGLKMKRADRADEVARDILNGLGGRTTLVPGGNGRNLTRLLSVTPRSLRVKILSAATKDMLRE
jgi:short-subunit dehydrogenase